MAVNGWNNVDYYGNPQNVRSLKIGPHTLFYGWDGPTYTGNAFTVTNWADTASWILNLDPDYQIASFITFQYFGEAPPLVDRNLALGRPTTQSSTAYPGSPGRAVDGNTDGNWYDASVTHTNLEPQPWWQVDLGQLSAIGPGSPSPWVDYVEVFNRTDCCADRLTNFNVLASIDGNGWATFPVVGQAGSPTRVTIQHYARYVRIQLAGTNYLSLAEVKAWGY